MLLIIVLSMNRGRTEGQTMVIGTEDGGRDRRQTEGQAIDGGGDPDGGTDDGWRDRRRTEGLNKEARPYTVRQNHRLDSFSVKQTSTA